MVLAARPRVMAPVAQRMRAMFVSVVKGKALLGMFATEEKLAATEKDRPCGMVSFRRSSLPCSRSAIEELAKERSRAVLNLMRKRLKYQWPQTAV